MSVRNAVPPLVVLVLVASLTLWAMQAPSPRAEPALAPRGQDDLRETVAEVNAALRRLWSETPDPGGELPPDGLPPIEPAARASDLTILRRLSLALHGTVPSLEEVRRFEADAQPDRLPRWTAAMLDDSRFGDYFAERLARGFVGVEGGQFLIFRRDRLTAWLSRQLQANRPYDAIVRDMLAARGVWTGEGEVNFLTAAYANETFDANQLAGRTARAFLGQRIDCAQCHDHPFDHWKQSEFEGLAAHFGRLDISLAGVNDDARRTLTVMTDDGESERTVPPALPYSPEWGTPGLPPRDQLAVWVTHPQNARFERAVVNRVWGLLFGRPFAHRLRIHSPNAGADASQWHWIERAVDDLPDPGDPRFGSQLELLDLLGRDFREHGCDLRRLILVIVASDAFLLGSVHPESATVQPGAMDAAELDAVQQRLAQVEARWGVFPLTRLRPEQVIGSMLQTHYVATINRNSHLFVRAIRFFREQDFVNEFGDPGVDELEDRTGTIPQALLRMNGDFARELSEEKPFSAPGQIGRYSSTPERLLENVFLSCLTRRPNEAEQTCFLPQLQPDAPGRDGAIQDLYWAIFNAPEFSWNH